MTKISIEEDLLNRLLAKCSAKIERHAGSADSANITFEKNRCVKTLFPKSSCTQCVQVCREQALSIKDQTIAIENSECSAMRRLHQSLSDGSVLIRQISVIWRTGRA